MGEQESKKSPRTVKNGLKVGVKSLKVESKVGWGGIKKMVHMTYLLIKGESNKSGVVPRAGGGGRNSGGFFSGRVEDRGRGWVPARLQVVGVRR